MKTQPKILNWKFPKFDSNGMTQWFWMCQHHKNLILGNYIDIGALTYINALYGITLGDYVQIGSHCSIYSVSTIDKKKGPVYVGQYAKIGTHSTVMPGIKIGKHALIGAYSFVNKNIPDGVLAFGIPIRVVRKLTEEELSIHRDEYSI